MDTNRKQQLRALIRSRFDDNQQKFADCVRLSKGRISQLLDPGEPFGERAAKSLIVKLADAGIDLPAGHFDCVTAAEPAGQYHVTQKISVDEAIAAIRAELDCARDQADAGGLTGWPFLRIKRHQWDSMTQAQRDAIEAIIQSMLAAK